MAEQVSTKTILVTGGAGYIGSHACKALAAAGYTPVTYDNLIYGHDWAAKWGPLEKGDILDPVRLSAVMTKYRPFAVMHFAAFAYVGESVIELAKYYRNNVTGTLTLLEAMRAHDIHRIVFSSSCATYGVPDAVPIPEETPQKPVSPYGASKLMAERIIADFGAAYGMATVALRYFNAAGSDPEGEIGEDHDPETHLVPLVLDAAIGARPNVTILGNDYDTPDGTCVRDYIHVSDIAAAHVLALQLLEKGKLRQAYNLGTGVGVSVLQVIEAVRRVTSRNVPVVVGPRRAGDPAILLAEAVRAHQDLGWRPQFSSIDKMIETAWFWRLTRQALHHDPVILSNSRK